MGCGPRHQEHLQQSILGTIHYLYFPKGGNMEIQKSQQENSSDENHKTILLIATLLGFPFVESRTQVQCGGTLLDQTTVLTAAHCFDQSGGPNVVSPIQSNERLNLIVLLRKVRLGDHDINTSSDGAQAVDVSIRR